MDNVITSKADKEMQGSIDSPVISIRDLAIGYDRRPIVSGLDFDVEAGDYFLIVGENGSGKSTLVKTILGLMKPISGEISVADTAIQAEAKHALDNTNQSTEDEAWSRRSKVISIGYLPQQADHQKDFPASVMEVVMSGNQAGKRIGPFYGKGDRMRAISQMKRMGIVELKHRSFRKLSGGQKQRVLIARALVAAGIPGNIAEPPRAHGNNAVKNAVSSQDIYKKSHDGVASVLLLDEPENGLDSEGENELYKVARTLNREGMTIVMVTHDFDRAKEDAKHVLSVGDPTFFGTTEEYISWSNERRFAK